MPQRYEYIDNGYGNYGQSNDYYGHHENGYYEQQGGYDYAEEEKDLMESYFYNKQQQRRHYEQEQYNSHQAHHDLGDYKYPRATPASSEMRSQASRQHRVISPQRPQEVQVQSHPKMRNKLPIIKYEEDNHEPEQRTQGLHSPQRIAVQTHNIHPPSPPKQQLPPPNIHTLPGIVLSNYPHQQKMMHVPDGSRFLPIFEVDDNHAPPFENYHPVMQQTHAVNHQAIKPATSSPARSPVMLPKLDSPVNNPNNGPPGFTQYSIFQGNSPTEKYGAAIGGGFYTPQAHTLGVRTFGAGDNSSKNTQAGHNTKFFLTPTSKPMGAPAGFSAIAERAINRIPPQEDEISHD